MLRVIFTVRLRGANLTEFASTLFLKPCMATAFSFQHGIVTKFGDFF